MKNNKIYKIITAVVIIALFFSIATVNASAFEHDYGSYVDITGDQDESPPYGPVGSIYGNKYALIQCGNAELIPYGRFDFNMGSIKALNDFLYSVRYKTFSSPSGIYTYQNYYELKYLELFLLCEGKLSSFGVYPVGNVTNVYLNGFYLKENSPGLNYSLSIDGIIDDYLYIEESIVNLVVACYFDDCSPYDGSYNKAPDLIENLETLEGDVQRLKENNRDLSIELNTEKAVHEQRVNDLLEELEAAESKLFEMENANALDQVFTGTSQGLVSLIREVAKLGYSPSPGVNITIGGLLTIGVIAAFVAALIGFVFGGKKSE